MSPLEFTIPANYLRALLLFVAKTHVNPKLTRVAICENHAVASDGAAMLVIPLPVANTSGADILLPASQLGAFLKTVPKGAQVVVTPIHDEKKGILRYGDTSATVPILDLPYLPWQRAIPQDPQPVRQMRINATYLKLCVDAARLLDSRRGPLGVTWEAHGAGPTDHRPYKAHMGVDGAYAVIAAMREPAPAPARVNV